MGRRGHGGCKGQSPFPAAVSPAGVEPGDLREYPSGWGHIGAQRGMTGLGKGSSEGRSCVSQDFWARLPSSPGTGRCCLQHGHPRQVAGRLAPLCHPDLVSLPCSASIFQSSHYLGWAGCRQWRIREAVTSASVLCAAHLPSFLGAEDRESP